MEAHVTAVAAEDVPLAAGLDILLPAAQAQVQPDSVERLVDTEVRDEQAEEETEDDEKQNGSGYPALADVRLCRATVCNARVALSHAVAAS